jgi:hypothetical protein
MISEFKLFRTLQDKGAMIKPNENPSVPRPGAILSESDVIDADIAMKNTFFPQVPVA